MTHILKQTYCTPHDTLCGRRADAYCAVFTKSGNWSIVPTCETCILLHFAYPYDTYDYNFYLRYGNR